MKTIAFCSFMLSDSFCQAFSMYYLPFRTGCTLGGLDLIFILDVSISIRSDRFQLIRNFVMIKIVKKVTFSYS